MPEVLLAQAIALFAATLLDHSEKIHGTESNAVQYQLIVETFLRLILRGKPIHGEKIV